MDEALRQVIKIMSGMWQRRWIGLLVAWVVAVVGAVVVMNIPDRYEAKARIFVDTQSVIRPLMAGLAINPNIDQQVAMLARTLISRPNIEKLMRTSDMDLLATTPKAKEALTEQLMSGIKLAGGRENLYDISYRDASPERARRVVQSFLSMFVESGLGDKRRDTETVRRFLDDQIRSHEARLLEAENRMKDFRLANLGVLSGGGARDYISQISTLAEELNRVQLELRSVEQSRAALKEQLDGEVPSLAPDPMAMRAVSTTPELDARIEAQRRQMDEMLRRYTDQHPDVIITRRLIEQLEAERKQQQEAHAKAAQEQSKAGPATNPVFQQIKIAISETDANIASLRAKSADLNSRIERMKSLATRVPQLETELKQMDRDYNIIKSNYDQLVARREQAALGQEVEVSGAGAEFRLIEPPRATPTPVFPDRMALVSLVLALSLGGGLFASFAYAQLYQTVQDTRTLREICSRPVLGAVSMLMTAASRRRRRLVHAAFGSGLAGLLVLYGAWISWVGWTLR